MTRLVVEKGAFPPAPTPKASPPPTATPFTTQLDVIDYPTDADVDFDYDTMGCRTKMTDGSSVTEWTYDTASRVDTYQQQAVDRQITYTYNEESSRTQMSVDRISAPGSPWTTTYSYDAAGRLDTLTDDRVGATPFDYT